MSTKTPVYIWKEDIIIRDAKDYPTNTRPVTPAENCANILQNLPACDVDALLYHLADTARYSVARGEDNAQMVNRMNVAIGMLTFEYKQTFG